MDDDITVQDDAGASDGIEYEVEEADKVDVTIEATFRVGPDGHAPTARHLTEELLVLLESIRGCMEVEVIAEEPDESVS